MNNTVEDSPEPQLTYAVIFSCIMVVGLPLNVMSLWIFLRRHSLKSPNVVFMINLAMSDLLLIISLPLRIYFFATGTWTFNTVICKSVNLLYYMNICTSSIFITFLSVDRLLAVVYPLRFRHVRTASNAMKAAALVWVTILLVYIIPTQSLPQHSTMNNQSLCFRRHPSRPKFEIFPVVAITRFVLLVVLLTVNVVSTFLVSWTLHKNLSDCAHVNNKVNVLLIYVMNLIIFIICFMPITVGIFINGEHVYLLCLATTNCCFDPLLYYFSLDAFWKKKDNVNLGQEL